MTRCRPNDLKKGRVATIKAGRKGRRFCYVKCAVRGSTVSVFVPPPVFAALGTAKLNQELHIEVVKNAKGFEAKRASQKPLPERPSWGAWQIGDEQVFAPETEPGSTHTFDLACHECGTVVVPAARIERIKGGAVWTDSILSTTVDSGTSFNNAYKQCRANVVNCHSCGRRIGALYLARYFDAPADQPFPCCKITIAFNPRGMTKNETVCVAATREDAEANMRALVLASDTPAGYEGVRINAKTHTLREERDSYLRELNTLRAASAAAPPQPPARQIAQERTGDAPPKSWEDSALADAVERRSEADAALAEREAELARYQGETDAALAEREAEVARLQREVDAANAGREAELALLQREVEAANAEHEAELFQLRAKAVVAEADAYAKQTQLVQKEAQRVEAIELAKTMVAASCESIVWECSVDNNRWVPFSPELIEVFETAYTMDPEGSVKFDRKGAPYEADFKRMTQKRCDHYTTMRPIRRTETSKAPSAQFITPGQAVRPGVVKFELTDLTATSVTHDTDECNKAIGHYTRLTQDRGNLVRQVDVYESEATLERFQKTKEIFGQRGPGCDEEIWVFHGTNDSAIEDIMAQGFKVGGVEVGARNGEAFGKGVYTATGPADPTRYSRGHNKIILARALPGIERRGGYDGDSWRPKNDWMVFVSGSQLLPVYVIHL